MNYTMTTKQYRGFRKLYYLLFYQELDSDISLSDWNFIYKLTFTSNEYNPLMYTEIEKLKLNDMRHRYQSELRHLDMDGNINSNGTKRAVPPTGLDELDIFYCIT